MDIRYCECGHPIEVDSELSGSVPRVVFRDGDKNRYDDGEIFECPSCLDSAVDWLKPSPNGTLVVDTSRLKRESTANW